MRGASTALKNFLFSRQGFVFADLYTFTMVGGNVKRWTSAGVPIVVNGFTYDIGPTIRDSGVKQAKGLQVDTIDITIAADSVTVVNGVPLIKFIRMNGMDGALVTIERCFATDWEAMMSSGPVGGTMIRYKGRFSNVRTTQSQAVAVVSSWLELLDVDMPSDVYQASCGNTLFDSRCLLSRASFAASALVDGTSTLQVIDSNISSPNGTYDLGSILFTTGPNTGLRRTVKKQVGGNITLVAPLVAVPTAGQAFTIYPGCDLSMGTCNTKFNNLIHFRGQPFVPVPETSF